jgi:hypothetical protein
MKAPVEPLMRRPGLSIRADRLPALFGSSAAQMFQKHLFSEHAIGTLPPIEIWLFFVPSYERVFGTLRRPGP